MRERSTASCALAWLRLTLDEDGAGDARDDSRRRASRRPRPWRRNTSMPSPRSTRMSSQERVVRHHALRTSTRTCRSHRKGAGRQSAEADPRPLTRAAQKCKRDPAAEDVHAHNARVTKSAERDDGKSRRRATSRTLAAHALCAGERRSAQAAARRARWSPASGRGSASAAYDRRERAVLRLAAGAVIPPRSRHLAGSTEEPACRSGGE